MKITKLRRSYAIRLTDTEMNVLCSLVSEGVTGIVGETDMDGWNAREKTAYRRRVDQIGDFMNTDENRRAA